MEGGGLRKGCGKGKEEARREEMERYSVCDAFVFRAKLQAIPGQGSLYLLCLMPSSYLGSSLGQSCLSEVGTGRRQGG